MIGKAKQSRHLDVLARIKGPGSIVGVVATLSLYGILQERIMSYPYGDQRFTSSCFVVFCNRLLAFDMALLVALVRKSALAPQVSILRYGWVSLLNVTATTCQYEALKWVSFPVQVMGKTMKMLPVMMWGVLYSQQSYPLSDWVAALLVTLGISTFVLTGEIAAPQVKGNSVFGLLLLFVFLAADSLTSTTQEGLLKRKRVQKMNQMLFVNGCSALLSGLGVLRSEGFENIASFSVAHPRFVWDVLVLSLAAVASQVCILTVLQEYGALALAAAMNARQLLSILTSLALFKHSVTIWQLAGLVMAFTGLFGKIAYKALSRWRGNRVAAQAR